MEMDDSEEIVVTRGRGVVVGNLLVYEPQAIPSNKIFLRREEHRAGRGMGVGELRAKPGEIVLPCDNHRTIASK